MIINDLCLGTFLLQHHPQHLDALAWDSIWKYRKGIQGIWVECAAILRCILGPFDHDTSLRYSGFPSQAVALFVDHTRDRRKPTNNRNTLWRIFGLLNWLGSKDKCNKTIRNCVHSRLLRTTDSIAHWHQLCPRAHRETVTPYRNKNSVPWVACNLWIDRHRPSNT